MGRIMPAVSGVLIVEAVKQVYAIAAGKRVRKLSHRSEARPAAGPLDPDVNRSQPGQIAFPVAALMKGPPSGWRPLACRTDQETS